MSALAWLFGLGALTIAFPFLFHLIRRMPKGETEFSSLMFLKPSRPIVTRRSRLENLLLLALRAIAILLIAIAFMRPFFRGADSLSAVDAANRRIAILLDTSASMQRSDLWEQAKQQVNRELGALEPGDEVALFTFDRNVTSIINFKDSLDPEDRSQQVTEVRESLEELNPTWCHSDLGRALVSVADSLDVWRDAKRTTEANSDAKLQIVVVSDLQQGSQVDSLQAYQWPEQVFVKFLTVVPDDLSNATVQILGSSEEDDDASLRVRVVNSEESKLDQFLVKWSAGETVGQEDSIAFYVPAGTSRVLKVSPESAVLANRFEVSGDRETFDNTFFVVPAEQQTFDLIYLGDDTPDDPEQPQFYLRRALMETPTRAIDMRHVRPGESLLPPDSDVWPPTLMVVTTIPDENQKNEIDEFLTAGGTVLFLLMNEDAIEGTANWTGARAPQEEANAVTKNEYLMLGEVDFSSPWFQPFASPRYNDFTRIRFWNHRRVVLEEDVRVLARFDNQDPVIWQRSGAQDGKVFALACGWQPSDSQLALSSKFVPLINNLIVLAAELPDLDRSLLVGDTIELPPATATNSQRFMVKPDGAREAIAGDQTHFSGVDQPGIYRLTSTTGQPVPPMESNDTGSKLNRVLDREYSFAVNVDRDESETAMLPIERLEMLNVKVGEQETAAVELAQLRTVRDRETENQQKVWKWLICAAILLLIAETWLAGRTATRGVAGQTEAVIQSAGPTSGEMI